MRKLTILAAAALLVLCGTEASRVTAAEKNTRELSPAAKRKKLLLEKAKLENELARLGKQLESNKKKQEALLAAIEAGMDKELVVGRAKALKAQSEDIKKRKAPLVKRLAALEKERSDPELMTVEERLAALEKRAGVVAASKSKAGDDEDVVEQSWYQRIELAFEVTAAVQSSLGAEPEFSEEEDVTDATIAFCLEVSTQLTEVSSVFATLEAGNGDGLDGDLPTFWAFNDDADDDEHVHLTEVAYDHSLFGESLTVRIGKLDLTGDCGRNDSAFDANAVGGEFLSGGFCNNVAVEFPDDNSAAAMAWWSPHKLFDLGIGIADADADWDNVADNIFLIAELDFKPVIFGKSGTYRAFGWLNDKPHELIDKPELDNRPGHGFGLSIDQEIFGPLSIFGRWAWERPDVYAVEHAWSVGLQVTGELWKRPDDSFGFAYGMAQLSDEMEDAYQAEELRAGDEHHLEFFYDLKVNKWITIRQDVQYAKNPEGVRDADDVWVFGIRAQLGF